MFHGAPSAGLMTYIVPLGVLGLLLVLRNARPRRLKIERLWLWPVGYALLLAVVLAEAPPPIDAVSIALLVAGAALGLAIGWQRARFTEIRIHPETHDLTSRASPIGLVFIFAIVALRYGARDFLAGNAEYIGVSVVTAGDALSVLAVATLIAQRLEIWRRANRMLAEARAARGPPPPESLVS